MNNFKDFTRAIAGIASALKGINTVVDDIPVPGSGGSSSDYSSTPHIIGKWIDGTSDVYEAVLSGTLTSSANQDIDISSILPDGKLIDILVDSYMSVEQATNNYVCAISSYAGIETKSDGATLGLNTTAAGIRSKPFYLILRFTTRESE